MKKQVNFKATDKAIEIKKMERIPIVKSVSLGNTGNHSKQIKTAPSLWPCLSIH